MIDFKIFNKFYKIHFERDALPFNARIVQPFRKVIFHRNEPARARNSIHRLVFSSGIHKHGSFIISYKLRCACASNIALSSGTNQ